MKIRQASKEEYHEVISHYERCGYRGGVQENDRIIIALEEERIIGAVRICSENSEKILRGMQVQSQYQNKGLGKAMLQYLHDNVDLIDCYCLPYKHLMNFYGRIGFREMPAEKVPLFLAERFNEYAKSARAPMIIMKYFQ